MPSSSWIDSKAFLVGHPRNDSIYERKSGCGAVSACCTIVYSIALYCIVLCMLFIEVAYTSITIT
jgi:hypothetical protein